MGQKNCTICGRTLDETEFYYKGYNRSGTRRVAAECKDCFKKREMDRYYEQYKLFIKHKTRCVKCGETRKYLLEFHHRDPDEKEFTAAHWRRHSKQDIEKELEKCDTLCKNCHAEFHHLEDVFGITYEDYMSGTFKTCTAI